MVTYKTYKIYYKNKIIVLKNKISYIYNINKRID